jgi:hypothetical protein
MQLENFKGQHYRLADNWVSEIPPQTGPINYLEIGAFYGGNLISVEKLYASHPDSKLYCIDPWEDYAEYDEYKGEMDLIYRSFQDNIKAAGIQHKISVYRGYSHIELIKLPDDYFDMIYIDGNHNPDAVLEDCVLSFRKLKVGGYMILDDYGFGGPDFTSRGINGFIVGFSHRIHLLPRIKDSQVFLQKTK